MDATRFDRITALFSERRLNRRTVLRGSAATAASLSLGLTTSSATHAQQATPVAEPDLNGEFLFVQSFGSGALAESGSSGAAYTLTLNAGLGQTLFFSNRPNRIVGTVPTPQFLENIGFDADNPPNAALIGEKDNGDQDLLVVELLDPTYDETSRTATYAVNVLQDDERVDMQFVTASGDTPAATTYTGAHLFIDDCPDANVACYYAGTIIGELSGKRGMCWDWSHLDCKPCARQSETDECNATIPSCKNQCLAVRN